MDLKLALQLNAALSYIIGFALALSPRMIGGWLDVSIDGWLRLLGLVLISHGALLTWATRQPSITSWAKLNVAAIAPYPVIMVAVVAAGLVDVAFGQFLLLIDGVLVGMLAVAQWSGLRAHDSHAHPVSA